VPDAAIAGHRVPICATEYALRCARMIALRSRPGAAGTARLPLGDYSFGGAHPGSVMPDVARMFAVRCVSGAMLAAVASYAAVAGPSVTYLQQRMRTSFRQWSRWRRTSWR